MEMSKLINKALLISLSFILCGNVLADRGVFNPTMTPDEILTNTNNTITITAEIGADAANPPIAGSIAVYETDSTGKPLRNVGQMYDDGTHGDATPTDTVFTMQFAVNSNIPAKQYFRVSAAYSGVRNRYLSPIMEFGAFPTLPVGLVDDATRAFQSLQHNFYQDAATLGFEAAKLKALADALVNPNIGPGNANLSGPNLSLMYVYTDPLIGFVFRIAGIVILVDTNIPTDAAGRSTPTNLPANFKSPGNDKLLIFAPGYNNPDPQKGIADHALTQFNNTEYITFSPNPPVITPDASASLELIKHWGDYGTVVMHTHGGLWDLNGTKQVVLVSGTPATLWNQLGSILDIITNRIAIAGDGRFAIYPSFITKHASSMKNTLFYLGACESLQNDTMWNALKGKGAKIAYGWNETVARQFNSDTFARLIDPMLPHTNTQAPMTAKQAFDNVAPKIDPIGGYNATLTMRTASAEWDNFVFTEGGIINGDFETGDWTGWMHGADPGNLYGIITGARKHAGTSSAAMGRWDTAFTGQNAALEPYGYEWIYQDFTVPANATKLSFWWWMETYDTAVWDWFDASLRDTNGNVLITLVNKGGKPGSNYGPYWNTGSWQYVETDVTAYRGQKVRIYFDQRLDGFGDQTRTYIDDVKVQ